MTEENTKKEAWRDSTFVLFFLIAGLLLWLLFLMVINVDKDRKFENYKKETAQLVEELKTAKADAEAAAAYNRAWADEWQAIVEAATGGDGVGQEYVSGSGVVKNLSLYMEWTQRWNQALYDPYKRGEPLPDWAAEPHHYPEAVFPACERKHWMKILELRQAGRFDEYVNWPVARFCGKNREAPAVEQPAPPASVQPCVPPVLGRTYAVTEDTWATVSDPRERVAQAVLMTGGTMRVVDVVADRWDRQVVVDYQLPPDQEEGGTLAPSGRAMLSVLRFCDATVGSAEAQRQVKLLEAP